MNFSAAFSRLVSLPRWLLPAAVVAAFVIAVAASRRWQLRRRRRLASAAAGEAAVATSATPPPPPRPMLEAVNYHVTRICNYKCEYCFHTNLTKTTRADHLPLDDAKRGITLLRKAGVAKINFAGGEPLLPDGGRYLGELLAHSKSLGLMTSVVTNGSRLRDDWMERNARHLDILAVSCDSGNAEINRRIGRSSEQANIVKRAADLCRKHGVHFKLNTVVFRDNVDDDMSELVARVRPMRWKVFQCLLLAGENDGTGGRDARNLLVPDAAFDAYCQRHRDALARRGAGAVPLVAEGNATMRASYWVLDEQLRFLDSSQGAKTPSQSLLEVGVLAAARQVGFDRAEFLARDGNYYARLPVIGDAAAGCGGGACSQSSELSW